MFGRPRCREWTPLATQQLRLRSLIQIVGYNIRPPECCQSQCSFYVTLHHTTMSAPFYTSERICSPHPKWKEIDSEITQRMSSNNIVIRIWCHELHDNEENGPKDTVIQTWGVYFSGLRYIGANLALNFTSDCFKSNTLVFQMLGGYFCSYKSLKLDIIPPENEIEQGSLSSDSSSRTNQSKINIDAKFILNHKIKESRSISPNKNVRKIDKEYSKSHSPVERNFTNYWALRNSTSLNIQNQRERGDESVDRKKPDPNFIYEHSPESNDVIRGDSISDNLSKNPSREDLYNNKIDLSETAENYDLRNESDGAPKYRYLALNFLKSEIRRSYNAKKLQQLHILQYEIKKKQESVQEIKEKIYQRSALSNDLSTDNFDDKLKSRSKSQRNIFSPEEDVLVKAKAELPSAVNENGRVKEERPRVNGPRLALKLTDLLSLKSKPSPSQRAEALRLTKQIEILRFKRLILADERDRKLATLRRLKEVRAKLFEQNQDVGLELLQDYHSLSRRTEALKESRQACGALRELAARSHAALRVQRAKLAQQLQIVFPIQQCDENTWSICGVELPVCSDSAPRAPAPLAAAAAAGLAAQAVCLAANTLDQPLRYKITLLGSESKIVDIRPDLANPNIPLYAQDGDVKLFRYGMFLLNKCIAQLMFARGLPVTDMRPTLANLRRLMTAPNHRNDTSLLFGTHHCFAGGQCPRTQSLRSLVASERGKHNRQFNRFKDAVDGQSPASAMIRRHRHSRSVGSYHDDQELPALDQSTTSIMGSEPNIYNTKLSQDADVLPAMKTHNSDSEISRISTDQHKVEFTIGEETPLEAERLVRISSNNDDLCVTCLNDNVKTICSEIRDFCTKDVHEGFDIASHIETGEVIDIVKHMEMKANEIDDVEIYKGCKRKEDDGCDSACARNAHDVIVMPCVEGADTGQDAMEDLREQTDCKTIREDDEKKKEEIREVINEWRKELNDLKCNTDEFANIINCKINGEDDEKKKEEIREVINEWRKELNDLKFNTDEFANINVEENQNVMQVKLEENYDTYRRTEELKDLPQCSDQDIDQVMPNAKEERQEERIEIDSLDVTNQDIVKDEKELSST